MKLTKAAKRKLNSAIDAICTVFVVVTYTVLRIALILLLG